MIVSRKQKDPGLYLKIEEKKSRQIKMFVLLEDRAMSE